MSYRLGINMLPQFEPGEEVVYFKPWVWGASAKSLPTYRLYWSLPPLWEMGVYVTDRRVLVVTHLLRLLRSDYSIWFGEDAAFMGREVVRDVSVQSVPILGRCVEVVSEDRAWHWYRSHRLRLRLFTRDPEPIYATIAQRIRR